MACAEDDNWDIKTGVGSTALFVAAARGLAGRQPQPLAVDRFAEVFCRAAGEEWAILFDADERRTADHPLRTPDFGLPFQDFQAARTRYFDEYLCGAADSGARQVVILAAGLDSRAYRLPWPGATVVYELDRPQVLEFKREVLAEHGDKPITHRREVPVDLRGEWADALRASGFDPSAPSAWLVEGLLMYLRAADQDQLFENIDALAGLGSFIGVEQPRPIDSGAYAQMTASPADGGGNLGASQWASLIYNEPRSEAVRWFGERGWSGISIAVGDYLASLGRAIPVAADRNPSTMIRKRISLVKLHRRA